MRTEGCAIKEASRPRGDTKAIIRGNELSSRFCVEAAKIINQCRSSDVQSERRQESNDNHNVQARSVPCSPARAGRVRQTFHGGRTLPSLRGQGVPADRPVLL